MNASNKRTSAILVVAICFTAMEAQACGEVMLRTMGTMRYRPFVTRHPAAILLYSGEAAAKRPIANDAKLHDGLEKAGHKVVMARGPDELAQALAAHRYDVIIADAADMDRVTGQIAKESREPALILVLGPGAKNAPEVPGRLPRLVSQEGNLNELLKTIEQSMKGPRT
jgi:hypothetical protein